MKLSLVLFSLLIVAGVTGCVGEKPVSETPITEKESPTPAVKESTPSSISETNKATTLPEEDDEELQSLVQELSELESLMKDLKELDGVSFDL